MSYQNISAAISDQDMEAIKKSLDSIDSKLSFLVHLTPAERHDLFKMGDKSLAFVTKSVMAAQQNRTFCLFPLTCQNSKKTFSSPRT
jgi:hypothetical protein